MTATMEYSFVTGSVISHQIFSILMFSLTIFKSLRSSLRSQMFEHSQIYVFCSKFATFSQFTWSISLRAMM